MSYALDTRNAKCAEGRKFPRKSSNVVGELNKVMLCVRMNERQIIYSPPANDDEVLLSGERVSLFGPGGVERRVI